MDLPVFHLLLSGTLRGGQRLVEAAVGRAAWSVVDDRSVSVGKTTTKPDIKTLVS